MASTDKKVEETTHASVSKIIIGTMEMGKQADQKQSEDMCSYFVSKGLVEVDTARMYAGGKTEKVIGKFSENLTKQIVISTKVNPWQKGGMTKAHVLRQAKASLDSLGAASVDIMYLHAPDHNNPIEDTLEAIQQLYKEGKFKRFGLSNYASWQVVEIYYICQAKGYVLPTVYQGMYNVITRRVEEELFPALHRLNIQFYAYNPLAGGILTNKYKFEDADSLKQGRFAGGGWAEKYRQRFWTTNNFDAITIINNALTKTYGKDVVPLANACIRWLMHHSKMEGGEKGDGLIVGASNMSHLVANTEAALSEPLHKDVVDAMDEAWETAKPVCVGYFR